MQSRRDQAQAYSFVTRRLSAAVIGADPDGADQPMRRLGRAAFLGLMVAVLAVAGVTVYGYVRPGHDTDWQRGGVLIVERDTSTRYVYTNGVLHPVLNYTSARLALASAAPPIVTVSAASLRAVPRGAPIGILGAPDDLPPATALVGPPWTVCTAPATDAAGTLVATSALSAGTGPGAMVPSGSALLVAAPSGQLSLLWQGHRLPLGSPAVRSALGYDAVAVLPVDAAVLSLVPPGPVLAPIVVEPGPPRTVAGQPARPGTVLETDSGAYYLVQAGGYVPLSALQALIQLAGPDYPLAAHAAVRVPAGAVAGDTLASSTVDNSAPATAPTPMPAAPPTTALCATTTGDDAVTLSVRSTDARSVADYAEPVDPAGGPLADQVLLPAGAAALVRAQPGPGVSTGTVYLVCDGLKFPIGDQDSAGLLGYQGVTPTPMPPAWVQLVPTGPTLAKAAATRIVPVAP